MTELELFQELKGKVLQKYKEHYSFFNGSWKTFSSQDIQKLIVLIENECKQSISEKWIYTHLKPEQNQKIPRKDMLDILSVFVGYSNWDELRFSYTNREENQVKAKGGFMKWAVVVLIILICGALSYFLIDKPNKKETKTLQLNNEYTSQKINNDEIKVFEIQDSSKRAVDVKDGKVEIGVASKRSTKLEITSPFYHRKIVDVTPSDTITAKIDLQPNDYAMMLKAFMASDIKDWQTRKTQLNKILSDDLEVLVMLRDNLGVEYFNKQEFSQKLVIPTISLKKMRIVELKNNEKGLVHFIRISE